MLDFQAVRDRELSLDELLAGVDKARLQAETNEMMDYILGQIATCTDADVVFTPIDPKANDPYASSEDEQEIAWNLGHLVVHVTASAEESAALAAEMARGVELHGRSRSEIPWETVTTIEQCRHRLEESRRMCLASLEMWPDQPYLDYIVETWKNGPQVNAIGRYVLGLSHAQSHLAQIDDVIQQAKAARS